MAYVLYLQGGKGAPYPPLFALVAPYCALSGHVQLLAGSLLCIPVPDLAICPGMSKDLGRGEGFAWTCGCTARLNE